MTINDEIAAGIRRDARHLLDLIEMLPGFDSDDFWDRVAAAEHPDRDDDGYFLKNMSWITTRLQTMLSGSDSMTPMKITNVAMYVLMFFDRNDPALHEAFARGMSYVDAVPGRFGHRWCEDVCATAWRLYVPGKADERRPEEDE